MALFLDRKKELIIGKNLKGKEIGKGICQRKADLLTKREKTQQSYRTIPLTDVAYDILKEIWDNRENQKKSPLLSQTLEYIDRRTSATRAIEAEMQPKVLQKLLGHSGIKTAMDRYLHVTVDSMDPAVRQFENNRVS